MWFDTPCFGESGHKRKDVAIYFTICTKALLETKTFYKTNTFNLISSVFQFESSKSVHAFQS